MTNRFQGYRTSRAGCGGALNGYRAPKAQQAWAIGMRVNVGFLKDLLVTGHKPGENLFTLVNDRSGARYEFQPHLGISRIN
jgi:hypothetical protein